MKLKFLIMPLFFCMPLGASGGGSDKEGGSSVIDAANRSDIVEIEVVKVAQMNLLNLDCSVHSLKDAILGLELIENEGNVEKETIVRAQMLSKDYYKEFSKQFGKKLRLSESDIKKHIKSKNIKNVFLFETERCNNLSSITFRDLDTYTDSDTETIYMTSNSMNSDDIAVLKELAEVNYIKSFVVSTGGWHNIACTIKKVNGVVTKAISMESSNVYNGLTGIGKVFKKNWLSASEAVQRIVDIANDSLLVEKINLYKKYKRCLKMAECISDSFYVAATFTHDYICWQYEQGLVLSEGLIADFARRFADYVRAIPESGRDRPSYMCRLNENRGLVYLSKIEFLEKFLHNSNWWTDVSLFKDPKGPIDFTDEERAEMIELMNVEGLLVEARKQADQVLEEAARSNEEDSGEERSVQESKGV